MYAATLYKCFIYAATNDKCMPLTPGKKSPGQKKSCTKPKTFDNAEIHPKYQNKKMFKHRVRIGYKCLPRFVKEGKLFHKCQDGKWTSVQGDCKLRTKSFGNNRRKNPCTKPIGVVNHAAIHPDFQNKESFKHRDSIRYVCFPDFVKEGDLSQECQDGQWTDVQGECKPGRTCLKPADVANANLRSKYRDIEIFNESSEVEYDCNIGYSITGRSRNRKCLKSRNWSPVEFDCELIRCTYLPHPENGRRTDANNGAGETTRFSCNPGYTLKGPSQLVCRTDGEWSPRYTPKCEPILCPELSSLRNGDIFQDTSDGVRNNYGSIAQYTCNYGFTINGTRSRQINRRCEADGTWDGHNYFCDTEKCEPIEFYGGNLQYFGSIHRAEGTYAYYSCHEGYTMSPSGIDYSECKKTSLKWEPEPPKCNGNCRFEEYQPIDTSLVRRQRGRRDTDAIIHEEKITYSCKYSSSYELCVRPNDQVLCTDDTLSENFETKCTNGTFDKINKGTHISCQERRCEVTRFTATQTNACYRTDDGQCRRENFKVDSRSTINIECLNGYELLEAKSRSYQILVQKMECIKGHFSTEYSCLPKRCNITDLPTNWFTVRTPGGTHIEHGISISYTCKYPDEYELYVQNTDEYPPAFSATCSFGIISRHSQEFPLCQERRCDVTSHMATRTHACFWKDTDQDGHCRRNSFKVDSRSSINIKCDIGYELDETKRKSSPNLVQKMECIKGHFSTEYSCLPKRCVLKDFPTNEFTVRTPGRTHIEHGKSISLTCKNPDEYELFVQKSYEYRASFSATCRFGEMIPMPQEFPLCEEKHCEFQPRKGVCYQRGEHCDSSTFDLKSQESIKIKCTDGYKLIRESRDEDIETATIKCIKGKPEEDIKCVPESEWEKFKERVSELGGKLVAKASNLFCRFSIVQLIACSDSCLPDKIENGVVTKTDAPEVLQEVKHGLQVSTRCYEGYDSVGRSDNTCEKGEWKYSFPQCIPKQCIKIFQDGEIVWHSSNIISRPTGSNKTYDHGTNLDIECASGYSMETQPQDSKVMTTECVLGVWKPLPSCVPKPCAVPAVSNAVLKSKSTPYYNHVEEVQYECKEDYHFEQEYSKGKNDLRTESHLSSKCELGNWTKQIPERCYPDGCILSILAGSRYFIYENNTKTEILYRDLIPHGTNVSTECITGYDMVKEKGGSLADVLNPEVYCSLGSWKNVHKCKKRCAAKHTSKVTNSSDDNVTLDFRHGDKACLDGREVTCNNSRWEGNDKTKCQSNKDYYYEDSYNSIDDSAFTDPPGQDKHTPVYANSVVTRSHETTPSETLQGCEIPSDPLFNIYDTDTEGGQELDPGTNIENGTTVFVKCSYTENYEYTFQSTSILCVNGVLEKENFICPEFQYEGDYECKITNGQVRKKYLNEVQVSCDDGYLLNHIEKTKTCECAATGLDCKSVPNPPTCVPENCKIPEKNEHDSGLTIYVPINGSDVGLSSGMEVKHGDSINFKCSYSETEHLELDYTRLECMKGKWLKVSANEEWLKLNSSDFPKCRTAICIPLCENGGKCVRDDTCECRPQSTGKRCEKVECDRECDKNGGKCIAPGKCGQCPHGNSGINCQDHIKYLIQLKTGSNTYAGPNSTLYVILHGDKYSSQKLYVGKTYYEEGKIYEDSTMAVDITPIRNITIGRDSVRHPNDLQVDFVSIFIDFDNGRTTTDDQFYNFDAEPDLWIDDFTVRTITLSGWPEQCVHTFQRERDWYPHYSKMTNKFRLRKGSKGSFSERTCKQMCVLYKEKQCNGVYFHQNEDSYDCYGFQETNKFYFMESQNSNYYSRSCLV